MRKFHFFFILLLVSNFTIAQGNLLEEYPASNGITYRPGAIINLNKGSAPNGDFVYLTMGGWAVSLDPKENVIPKSFAGLAVELKKIRKQKMKGAEKVIFVVGAGNITNYTLDIEQAIESCEIKDCIDSSEGQQNNANDPLERLKKLKELLDIGAITQEEYDLQKTKILKEIGG